MRTAFTFPAKAKVFANKGAQLIIIKPQTHGKSQRSEIFVNKAAEPRRKRAMPVGYCEKPASCVAAKSALNLPHTYGFWEKGEFFAINIMCALKKAKKREKTPQKTRKRLMGGVALQSRKTAGDSSPRISRA